MTFVQIGRTIINMERVTDIHLGLEKVNVYFGHDESGIELKDHRAETFRDYLRGPGGPDIYVALSEAQVENGGAA